MVDQTQGEKTTELKGRVDGLCESLDRVESATHAKLDRLELTLKEHAEKDDDNMTEIRECTNRIELKIAWFAGGLAALLLVIEVGWRMFEVFKAIAR